MTPPSCRLFVILARDVPKAVILRRGPSRWFHVILWDMAGDLFTPGAWLHGRIYEEKCDLSPDGQLFVYFAYKTNRIGESTYAAFTAVSRPPWLRALVMWPQDDTYGGGGRFPADRILHARPLVSHECSYPAPLPGLKLKPGTWDVPATHASSGEVAGSDWSGRDHRCRVIFTVGGKLFRRDQGVETLLADFTDLKPDPQPPPAWANDWPGP
ncbi:hypothetical protein TA3x_002814 [Tundrisphaera sp. TA3]|uniref:hypothetical protein n=1 Tax=Tundrisphaera sp. TA3 TaxID=3435775 RepID=UPI003EB6A695